MTQHVDRQPDPDHGEGPREPDPAAQDRAHGGHSGQGTEAMPDQAEQHTAEHESGYGGKGHEPRVSSDQRPGT